MKPFDPNDPSTWTRDERRAYLMAPILIRRIEKKTYAGVLINTPTPPEGRKRPHGYAEDESYLSLSAQVEALTN